MKKKTALSTHGSTLFLRTALTGLGLLVAVLCVVVVPAIYSNWNAEFSELSYLRLPVLMGIFVIAAAFFVAARQAWKLLDYFDKNKAFSGASVQALNNIKLCAFIIGSVFTVAMPLVYYIAEQDDAPGLIIFGMLFVGIPIVVGVFAGVLQKILQNAIAIKSENDLTV